MGTSFVQRVFVVVIVTLLCVVLWSLRDVLLLLFGAVLIATTLRSIARPLIGVGDTIAVVIAAILVLAITISVFSFFGAQLVDEGQQLATRFDAAFSRISSHIKFPSLGQLFGFSDPTSAIPQIVSRFLSWGISLTQAAIALLLVLVGGFYLAVDPDSYCEGALKLVPPAYQNNARATINDISGALHKWITGQFTSMIIVGVLTGVGLWFAGVESAIALGVLAAFANFIPYIGSVLAALVTLVIAAAQGWDTLGWAAAVMFGVQQIESNVIAPLVVGGAVSIMPATGLFSIVAMGVLFGPLGILFGFPLAIATDIAIRRLYIRDALNEDVEILGSSAARSDDVARFPN